MTENKSTICSCCGTIDNAHHSAECIDTNGKGYQKEQNQPDSEAPVISEMLEETLIKAYSTTWYKAKNKYGITTTEAKEELKRRGTPICPVCFSLLRNGLKVCCGVWH